jgi:hypothetical protein
MELSPGDAPWGIPTILLCSLACRSSVGSGCGFAEISAKRGGVSEAHSNLVDVMSEDPRPGVQSHVRRTDSK